MSRSELVEITVRRLDVSERHVLVTTSTPDKAEWLPLAQVGVESADLDDTCTVTLPVWLARERGLI